ncbi:MAG: pyruvate dehydrogenase (acetyl-transferring) E1 component subunit alpha [Chloroflexi bacterium]|nr:pyruvate dehydrogenase (acetyl-transferring) E1 component subunit alpha [Chloroflexota bacterium]
MAVQERLRVSKAQGVDFLRTMMLIRRFEERCAEMYMRGRIGGFLHLYVGEEAVATGVMAALGPQDTIATHYREHGLALARGMDPKVVMAELFGRATGSSKGKGGSMHLFDARRGFLGGHAIVGAQMPFAAGLALAAKYRGEDGLALCVIGDGAVNQGEFHESINLAALWKLPVFFLLENNGFGMGTRVERACAQPEIFRLAERHNVKAKRADGMDVLEVHEAATEAVAYIRAGNGPYFLELLTYRFRGHSMADPMEYRKKQEVDPWLARDPITLFTALLLREETLTQAEVDSLWREVEQEVDAATEFAEKSPFPSPEALYEDVYA